MFIQINIHDYIDDKRITEIVEEEFRNSIRGTLGANNNVGNVLSNISYDVAFRLVCAEFNISCSEFHEIIKQRIVQILRDPNAIRFEVFRKKDSLNDSDSPAVEYLHEVLLESKPKIEAAVNSIIDEYPFTELRTEIEDTIYECIMRKFRENP